MVMNYGTRIRDDNGTGRSKGHQTRIIITISSERKKGKDRQRETERERMLIWEDDTYQTTARFLLPEGATGATIPTEVFVEIALVRH